MNNKPQIFNASIIFGVTSVCTAILSGTVAQANDSTGYIGTGGVEYIKNKHISMHSEDLYISKDEIRVNYEFKNLSNKDITETILFPMPAIPSFIDSDYADTSETYNHFKVWVDGQPITPTLHVRTFMQPIIIKDGRRDYTNKTVDTTALFRSCGMSNTEMINPWQNRVNFEDINRKLLNCDDKRLDKFLDDRDSPYFSWDSQIIYSWQQTFKANKITKVKHTYTPLVGGSVMLGDEHIKYFCIDKSTQRGFSKNNPNPPYQALSYILTTGANWAKPIKDFKLTVERDANELVSFCWKGKSKVKKTGATTFEIKESNFVPTHDFDVTFIMN